MFPMRQVAKGYSSNQNFFFHMNPSPPHNQPSGVEPITYSVAEAAEVLGVSSITIYRLIYRRMLRPVPGLRHKRISKKQVNALAQGNDGRV